MALKVTKQQAYADGRRAGEQAAQGGGLGSLYTQLQHNIKWAKASYMGAEDVDLREELLKFSRQRMASDPDLTRYPECRGLRELVEAERQGFAEALDDPVAAAAHFDWYWFCSRRLNTRFVGRTPPPSQCTDFWFGDTQEDGPIHGSNRDDVLFRYPANFRREPTTAGEGRHIKRITCVGGVSAAVLCDEEPECLFPVNLDWIMPDGIAGLGEHVAFMESYREFWGPGNQLWVDPEMNFAALEKANIRMGVRYSQGRGAITACAYLTPEMNAFKKERDRASLEVRGWTEDSLDAVYWDGCERRYRRLLGLVEAEAERGATLIGAAQIALDHAVPFPDRICLAGEQGHPDEKMQNWTLNSFARCISGPNRRMLWWCIDPTDPVPIYHTPCVVAPGGGLEHRRAEWEQQVAAAGEIGLHPVGH